MVNDCHATIVNCTISDNTADDIGSGASFRNNSSSKIINSILWNNTVRGSVYEIYVDGSSPIVVNYSDIDMGNPGNSPYPGTGNINADPMFIGSGDYHLSSFSPCIDTATADVVTYPYLPVEDIDGNPRPQGGSYDMGVDEFLSNRPPQIDAGDNVLIESMEQPNTVINGTASDPDNDTLQFRWLEGTTVLQDWQLVDVAGNADLALSGLPLFSLGSHPLTLEVKDGTVNVDDGMILTISNSPPTAVPMGAGNYEINTPVNLQAEVADFNDDILDYYWLEGTETLESGTIATIDGGTSVDLPVFTITTLSLENHIITLKVDDGHNSPVLVDLEVIIQDNQYPTLAPVADIAILWPPNHKMVDIQIQANAADNSGSVSLSVSVSSSEPAGNEPDFTEPVINGDMIFLQLRAEREGGGNGREYFIVISATDDADNVSTTTLTIIAPHDRRKK